MNATARTHKLLALVLSLVLVLSLLPVSSVSAAETVSADNVIFFATDRHEETSKLNSLLSALAYTPGLVVLGGDHVNDTNSGSLASITAEIQAVYPGVQTFYTYAAHDPNVSADSSNPYAFARTGEVYEGADYYVYGVDQDDMSSASSASTASQNFISWAETADSSKVIFVMCHMPIHSRRGDNAGGATWMTALNEVGESHDVVFLWGHNHTGESSADTSVYFVNVGGSLTPQGGSTGTINFTYMNAGYIKNGYASMIVVNSDSVSVSRYSTSGSVTASYSIERRFATSHAWEETESVAATCTEAGYVTYVCSDCGETKTTTLAASGHVYSSVVQDTCTGSSTVYTCTVCGDSYSEQNATETTYDSASSLTEGESYVIVVSNYALTYGSSAGRTSVTVSNGSITSDVTEAMVWTYQNGMLSNSSSGTTYYINVSSSSSGSGSNRPGGSSSSSSRTITFSTSGATVSYSSSKLKIGSYYLYHSSSSGFSARSSGSTVTLYQVNAAYGGTGEHTYETVTVEATCTANGSITYTCTGCGDSYSEVIETNGSHSYEVAGTVEATCTDNGSVTYSCTACGDTYEEVVEANGAHSYEVTGTVEATCTDNASVTSVCTLCGSTTEEVIAATGHNYETTTVEATCTTQGTVTNTCVNCGDSYTETVPALGHSYETVTVEATCETAGSVTTTCANCGDTSVEVIAALGHAYTTVTTQATCETAGCATHTCVNCGDSFVTDVTAALGHSYEGVTVEATCTTAGCTTYTCAACGDSYVADETAALGHSYEGVTMEATCTTEGSVTTTCTVCEETTVVVIAALGHSYEAVTVAATCETAGSVTTTCAACGDTSVEVIAALGHSYETVTLAATCETAGSVTTTCANCGDASVEVIEALGHAYTSVTTEATCETAGCTTHTCANCGDAYVTDEIAALGHAYASVTVAATCTEAGYTTNTCANCGDTYVTDQVAATGHSYNCVESDSCLTYTCSGCGDSYTEVLETVHTYSKVTTITSGKNYVITLYSGSKYYALSHEGNTISVVQITVSGGEITSEITEDLVWSYENNKLFYEDNDTVYYLYAGSSGGSGGWFGNMFGGSTLSLSTTNSSTVSFSSSKLKVGSNYLRYSNGSVSLNRSATTTYLFEEA